ncbi:MAG: CRISPR-associated protein Cas4 [Candidatus Micrarchaeaceae archaeon]|nr:CRISPR-associated protein Cas4 [Candidatus Jingweiarchaeum tengchongense]
MELQGQSNSTEYSDESIEIDYEILIGGVKVNYYFHCTTQLWLFSHYINYEQESDLVIIGKILEKEAFKNIKTKNLLIDDKISLDFIKNSGVLTVVDIKKSSKFEKSHFYQVLYYLWYLKNIKKIMKVRGIVAYPSERKRIEVDLTSEKESEMLRILEEINKIISLPESPKPVYKSYCKSCAYYEFCWV